MTRMLSRRANVRDDNGLAMLTAITVLALLTAIGLTVTTLGVNNLQNANRDRQAGAALGASDAGVAQAIEYIRGNGVGGLNCLEAQLSSSCPDNNAAGPSWWTNPSNPKQVPLASGVVGCTASSDCARVWIGTVQQFAPPLVKTGIYRIHSKGVFGNGPGARNVAVDITVTPDAFPIGVFGEQISGNGGTRLFNESLFARSCISPRDTGNGNGTKFSGIDPYWGIPAAAHTTSHVSTANACSSSGYIHASSPATKHCPDGTGYNALAIATMRYDQSGDGGAVSSASACYHSYLKADGTYYPENDSTLFTTADLQKYGYRPRGLTDAQYSGLKSRAQAQGLYNISPGSINAAVTTLLASGTSQPVLYFDNGDVSLSYSNFPAGAFERAPAGTCSPRSVVVVVEHGNLTWQGGNSNWFDGAFFVPDGTWTGNGGYNVLGTLWANNVSLGGNEQFQLDSCYVTNAHGAILDIKTKSFREDDAQDIN